MDSTRDQSQQRTVQCNLTTVLGFARFSDALESAKRALNLILTWWEAVSNLGNVHLELVGCRMPLPVSSARWRYRLTLPRRAITLAMLNWRWAVCPGLAQL